MRRRKPGSSPEIPPELTDASRGERLQRVMADAGVASRRDCERLIESGAVEVNGVVVSRLPVWIDPEVDRVVVSGRPLPPRQRLVYVAFNKPPRTLSVARDEPGADRRTVLDLVEHPSRVKLFPVGRLDYDTVGLLILTNDGELANRLTHPRFGVPKTYRAVVGGRIDEEAAKELERGIMLADRRSGRTTGASRTNPVELSVAHAEADRTTLDITIREGRNRQVRRMLAAVDLPVKKLERLAMGPITLRGLARGEWRELTAKEVAALRRSAAAGPEQRSNHALAKRRPVETAKPPKTRSARLRSARDRRRAEGGRSGGWGAS